MADWGIKSTKTGFDVATATIPQQSLNSGKNTFKILKEGIGTVNVTSAGTVVSVSAIDTFSSNTFPAFMAYMKLGTNETWYQPYITEQDTGKNINMDLWLDPAHFLINATLTATSGTTLVTVYFYELVEPSVNI